MRLRNQALSLAAILWMVPPLALAAPQTVRPKSMPFIKRVDDRLYEGFEEFRFMGLAAPTLHQNEEQLHPNLSNRFPDDFEMLDVLRSMDQMGGRVTRIFPPSFRLIGGDQVPVYVEGIRQYNDDAFRTLDRLLQKAESLQIRVIIPLIDSHSFWGWRGIKEFASYRGLSGDDFFHHPILRDDFKRYILDLLTRRNVYTGRLYRDEPAILAWQLGNELDSYIYDNGLHRGPDGKPDPKREALWRQRVTDWSLEMAAYIKSLDPNHLVMEAGGERDQFLVDPSIDIMSEHLYAYWNERAGRSTDLAALLRQSREAAKRAKKALIVDEFGMSETPTLIALMREIVLGGTSGGLLWGIRGHRRDGGFFHHNENGTRFDSYRWPGFPSGDHFDERLILNDLRHAAYAIQRRPVPPIPPPVGVPMWVHSGVPGVLRWRGTTGAASYRILRADGCRPPFVLIAPAVRDDPHDRMLFVDPRAKPSETYCYVVIGQNPSGITPPSRPLRVGPKWAQRPLKVPTGPRPRP